MATGKCVNIGGGCSKALKKYVVEADKANFVCKECGKPLVSCDGPVTDPDCKAAPTGTAAPAQGGDKNKRNLIIGVGILAVLGIGGAVGYFLLNKEDIPMPESIRLSSNRQELSEDEIDTLKVTTTPIDCPATYTWTSSDEKVAKVDANGVVTMTGEGQATVIVTAVENAAAKDSCVYTVKGTFEIINVESMTFMETEKDMQLKAGEEKQLNIDCTPGNANEMVSWRSENVSIATVENDGIVKAVAPGITTITAVTDRSGSSASIKVTVTKEGGIKEGGTGKVDTGTQKLDLGFAIYEGCVIKGKPEGNGTMTFKKKCIIPGAKDDIEAQAGEYAIGRWHNGKVNVVTLYQKNGNQVTILSK